MVPSIAIRKTIDAVLLLLLGQRELRNNESVGGTEIAAGLRQSGQAAVRPDRVTDRLAADGAVITVWRAPQSPLQTD